MRGSGGEEDRRELVRKDEKVQPLGTGQSSLGKGLERGQTNSLGFPLHTPGARSSDSARGEAERAELGRQSPGRARRAPGGPAPSSAASFAGLFLRGSGSRPSIATNNSSGPALGSRLPERPAPGRGGGGRPRRQGSAANAWLRPGLQLSSVLRGSLLAWTEEREPGGGAGVAAAAGARGGARERGREAANKRASERGREEVERRRVGGRRKNKEESRAGLNNRDRQTGEEESQLPLLGSESGRPGSPDPGPGPRPDSRRPAPPGKGYHGGAGGRRPQPAARLRLREAARTLPQPGRPSRQPSKPGVRRVCGRCRCAPRPPPTRRRTAHSPRLRRPPAACGRPPSVMNPPEGAAEEGGAADSDVDAFFRTGRLGRARAAGGRAAPLAAASRTSLGKEGCCWGVHIGGQPPSSSGLELPRFLLLWRCW